MLESLKKSLDWLRSFNAEEPVAEEPSQPSPPPSLEALAGYSLLWKQAPRETLLMILTKDKDPYANGPEDFYLKRWPHALSASVPRLLHSDLLQRLAMVPYRFNRVRGILRLCRVTMSKKWCLRVCCCAPDLPDLEYAEAFLYLEDPDYELVDHVTGMLTPWGHTLVRDASMKIMMKVMEQVNINGHVIFRLKPPQHAGNYDLIRNASIIKDSN